MAIKAAPMHPMVHKQRTKVWLRFKKNTRPLLTSTPQKQHKKLKTVWADEEETHSG